MDAYMPQSCRPAGAEEVEGPNGVENMEKLLISTVAPLLCFAFRFPFHFFFFLSSCFTPFELVIVVVIFFFFLSVPALLFLFSLTATIRRTHAALFLIAVHRIQSLR